MYLGLPARRSGVEPGSRRAVDVDPRASARPLHRLPRLRLSARKGLSTLHPPRVRLPGRRAAAVRTMDRALIALCGGRGVRGAATSDPLSLAPQLTSHFGTIMYPKFHMHLYHGVASCRTARSRRDAHTARRRGTVSAPARDGRAGRRGRQGTRQRSLHAARGQQAPVVKAHERAPARCAAADAAARSVSLFPASPGDGPAGAIGAGISGGNRRARGAGFRARRQRATSKGISAIQVDSINDGRRARSLPRGHGRTRPAGRAALVLRPGASGISGQVGQQHPDDEGLSGLWSPRDSRRPWSFRGGPTPPRGCDTLAI